MARAYGQDLRDRVIDAAKGRKAEGRHPSWPLEDDDHGRPESDRHGAAHGPRRPDQPEQPSRPVSNRSLPELKPGDIVVTDNLSSHKGPKVRQAIERSALSAAL